MKAALIGFGEVGQVLGNDLAAADVSVYDTLFHKPRSEPARCAETSRCTAAQSAPEAVGGAQVVISAVTVDRAIDAAQSVQSALKPGAWFMDLNSASPQVRRTQAALIEGGGGRYVEVAVMSPINPKRLGAPLLLGGRYAEEFSTIARALGFTAAEFYSTELGQASAAKLCRSVLIKGFESLLAESLVAARHFGVEQTVLASLKGFPGTQDWDAAATYNLSRTVKHGARRSAEMAEAAATVAQSGVEPTMAAACAKKQAWAAGYATALESESLGAMLDALGPDKGNSRE
ncbi:MAG: DUF1932 domain-containing protein [Pseudomonadota bacterium]